jgi:hypothetical protein
VVCVISLWHVTHLTCNLGPAQHVRTSFLTCQYFVEPLSPCQDCTDVYTGKSFFFQGSTDCTFVSENQHLYGKTIWHISVFSFSSGINLCSITSSAQNPYMPCRIFMYTHQTVWLLRSLGSEVYASSQAVLFSWQDEWLHTQDSKLQEVKPSMQVCHCSSSSVRREEVMITFL